jgi:hypothetical protein
VLRLFFLSAALAMIAACSDGSGPAFGTCPQTYEFGNFGCARVEGVVRDQTGTPLANARVTLTPVDEATNSFDSPMHDTDSTGRYSLEIHDYGFGGRTVPPADPVPMNLRAFLLPESSEDLIRASDVIPVNLKFAPVGELPEVLEMDITIDVTP